MDSSKGSQRRKVGGAVPSSSSRHGSGVSDQAKHLVSKEPEFRNASRLFLAASPSMAIIFAFGGRPSFIALCFGSFVGYMLGKPCLHCTVFSKATNQHTSPPFPNSIPPDLMGSVEGAVMSIALTLVAGTCCSPPSTHLFSTRN